MNKNIDPITLVVSLFFAVCITFSLPHFGIETIIFLLSFVSIFAFFSNSPPPRRRARMVPFYPLKNLKK
jgi:apolipoprotein N-acyltransferase